LVAVAQVLLLVVVQVLLVLHHHLMQPRLLVAVVAAVRLLLQLVVVLAAVVMVLQVILPLEQARQDKEIWVVLAPYRVLPMVTAAVAAVLVLQDRRRQALARMMRAAVAQVAQVPLIRLQALQ
jgi:hypothetical protein